MKYAPFIAGSLITFAVVSLAVWATDFVTPSGEWTIYTAECKEGQWKGSVCSGQLARGTRYRFRALKAHREVLFWTVGEAGESGRYMQCDITDGRNWSCPQTPDAGRTIAHRITRGVPDHDTTRMTIAAHRVPKWKWEAMGVGMPVGRTAME